ncbi:MipA/OmpV family protein [Sphingomonas sp. PL-96]|uniref:MipA/OmpV family protein n=1 Tax=Sphingomonas sp. PL-96 TaxID=2887201 RepID=UPI001E4F25D3|nr:MipA/OmpV family protein [Sphingomonas sp. PL-96]MCC2975461.1 MipA/OmpV family protein [Sphingomonas sp. PL-96]
MSLALLATGSAAFAQDAEEDRTRSRTRIALGPQLVPSFPGSDSMRLRPLIDIARTRGNEPFPFEAPDEAAGPILWRSNGWQLGPALGVEGKRSRKDTDGLLPKVGFTVELGGFVQYQLAPSLRLRTEVRQGIGGHKGLIGTVSADYVARDRDQWLFSIGPRVTLTNDRYHRAYFGVDPASAAASGLSAYKADGGLQAVGAGTGFLYQLTPRWGLYSYAKYDRLVADAGRSPVVRAFGSRNQLSGGVALSFTFR